MIKRSVLLLVLVNILQACGQSDIEAPQVGGKSPYSCDQLNQRYAMGDMNAAGRMINVSLVILENHYSGDSSIEKFYRSYVQKDVDYALKMIAYVKQKCLTEPDLGLNDASSEALTSLYSDIETDARWATCKSYLEGSVEFDDVFREMEDPSVIVIGGDVTASKVRRVIDSPEYGENYIIEKLDDTCSSSVGLRIWEALDLATKDAVDSMKAEKERMAEKERKERLEKKHQKNMDEYSVSIFDTGDGSCERFYKQYTLARRGEGGGAFLSGMIDTMNKAAADLESHKKNVFEEMMKSDHFALANKLRMACRENSFRYSPNMELFNSLLSIEEVKSARSAGEVAFYDSIKGRGDGESKCRRNELCEAKLERQAVGRALHDYNACKEGLEKGDVVCFVDVAMYYNYNFTDVKLEYWKERRNELEEQIKAPIRQIDLEPDLEECKLEALDNGLRGSEYEDHVREYCIPHLEEKVREPIRAKLMEIKEFEKQMTQLKQELLNEAM